jgi:putative NADPH-quinone reductase
MRHLIVTSHPSSRGFTHRIAKAFMEKAIENGDKCEILDLYDKQFAQGFLKFEDISKVKPSKVVLKIQKKIRAADNLVFVSPVWWSMPTAIMKNFFDTNLTPNFAYKYIEGKMMPKKLLTNKTAQIFMTSDAPSFFYAVSGLIGKKFFKALGFCGIKIKSFTLFGSMRGCSAEDLDKRLLKVQKLV